MPLPLYQLGLVLGKWGMTVGLAELGQGHLSTLTPAFFIRSLVPQLGLRVATDEVIPSTLEDGIRTPPRGTIGYTRTVHVLLLDSRSLLVLQILISQGPLALPDPSGEGDPPPVTQTRLDLKEQARDHNFKPFCL